METKDMVWRTFARDELSDALAGGLPRFGLSFGQPRLENLGLDSIAVGFMADSYQDESPRSCLIVLDGESRFEILAWLRVNCPEIFPLSQHGRVISSEDLPLLDGEDRYSRHVRTTSHERLWASIIIGEMISHGDEGQLLTGIPLSRAASCYSTAAARSHLTYGPKSLANEKCLKRLKSLDVDKNFLSRHIRFANLEAIWRLAYSNDERTIGLSEAVNTVLDLVQTQIGRDFGISGVLGSKAFASDSIEDRVIAFNAVVENLGSLPDNARREPSASAVIGIAAYLVGRGTSHEFLVRRNLGDFPLAALWFSVIAGLTGPSTWDLNWFRLASGVLRQIHKRTSWNDFGGYDLSWSEYEWFSTNIADRHFSDIPRLTSRGLGIELVPGVVCQLRMAFDSHSVQDADARSPSSSSTATDQISEEARSIFSQLIKLAVRAESVVYGSHQTTLFEPPQRATKSASRRGKGRS